MNLKYSEAKIRQALANHEPRHVHQPGRKPAAVLVPFYPAPEGLSLVLMKRPDYPGVHGDQISFPGGSREESDRDDLQTALRETHEEIGVRPADVDVWGALSTQNTLSSRFSITPFAGRIPYPYTFAPDSREVERLIIVPFAHLLAPDSYAYGYYDWKGITFESDLYYYGDDIIWGLTARILNQLISLIKTGREAYG